MKDDVNAIPEIDYRDIAMDAAVAITRTYEVARDNLARARNEVTAAKKVLDQKQIELDRHISDMKSARKRLESALANSKPTE